MSTRYLKIVGTNRVKYLGLGSARKFIVKLMEDTSAKYTGSKTGQKQTKRTIRENGLKII